MPQCLAEMVPCVQETHLCITGGIMKKLIFAVCLVAVATVAQADQYVNGYTRQDGTYVNGYTRSTPDSSYNNNFSTRGNVNPYTGSYGSSSPTYNDRSPSYNQEHYGSRNTYSSPYGTSNNSRNSGRRGW